MNEEKLIEKVITALSGIEDTQAQSVMDFTEKRVDNMIIVGISETRQLNEGCDVPDYEHSMDILIDCGIPEDDDGSGFYRIISQVKERLLPYELNQSALASLFGEIPVVYFQFVNQTFGVSERSNTTTLRYRIITSY